MPLVNRTFDQLINFTRTTAATFVGSNGLIQTTPQSRNLFTFTEEFDNAAWNKSGATVTANITAAPDGTATADALVEDASTGLHLTQQFFTFLNATAYTFSIYVRPSTRTWVSLTLPSAAFGAAQGGFFDLTGAGALGNTTGTPTSRSITAVGGGWYRITVTATSTAAAGGNVAVVAASANGTTSYAGNSSTAFFLWGAQLEQVPDANFVLGSELRGSGVVSTTGSPSPLATYNTATGEATLNRVDGSNVSGVRIPVGGAGRAIRVSVTITATTGTVQVRGNGVAGTILGVVGSTAGTYLLYVVSDTADIYLTMAGNATTASITINSVREITGTTGMPSDYTRNFGGLFPPRFDYDPVTLAPRGLLIEEQRTNRTLNSEDFTAATWVATVVGTSTRVNDGAPLGFTRGLITATSANGGIRQIHAGLTSGQVYALSFYIQSTATSVQIVFENGTSQFGSGHNVTINPSNGTAGVLTGFTSVSIQPFGPGYVYTLITAPAGGALSANIEWRITNSGNSIWLGRPQFEAGAFATSYIPTVASQVTRTADIATIAAPNFASWYNQTEGTFVAGFDSANPSSRYAVSATDGTSNNFIAIDFSSGGQIRGRVTTGGVSQASLGAGAAVAANAVINAGIAYRENSVIAAAAGTLSSEDTSVTLPAVNQLSLGALNAALLLNGHIRSIRYYPSRLSNAQLQALTA